MVERVVVVVVVVLCVLQDNSDRCRQIEKTN